MDSSHQSKLENFFTIQSGTALKEKSSQAEHKKSEKLISRDLQES